MKFEEQTVKNLDRLVVFDTFIAVPSIVVISIKNKYMARLYNKSSNCILKIANDIHIKECPQEKWLMPVVFVFIL